MRRVCWSGRGCGYEVPPPPPRELIPTHLNNLSKEHACYAELLLRVLVEKAVLIEEVMQHTAEDVPLTRIR
jgi:hypothetical protein